MRHAPDTRQRLEQAEALAEVLDAAYDGFSEMLLAIRGYQESGRQFYAALVMAAAAAADGRDAVAAAPSLPPSSDHLIPVAAGGSNPSAVADLLVALSELIGSRLRGAVTACATPGDRQACSDGATYADEVRALTKGNGP